MTNWVHNCVYKRNFGVKKKPFKKRHHGRENCNLSIPRYSFLDPMIRMVRCEQARLGRIRTVLKTGWKTWTFPGKMDLQFISTVFSFNDVWMFERPVFFGDFGVVFFKAQVFLLWNLTRIVLVTLKRLVTQAPSDAFLFGNLRIRKWVTIPVLSYIDVFEG